jgi:hypothetical protein
VAVATGAIMRMTLVLVLVAVLVMPERHALRLGDRGDGLRRDGHGQQQDRKKAEETSRHRRLF